MLNELKDVVELATSLTTLTKEILKLKPNNKNKDEDKIVIANKKGSAQIGSSGYSAQIGSSGYYAQIGSSGYSAQIGSSGDYAQIGSSGDYAKIAVTGDYTIVCGIGNYSIVKGKIGTWITLAEFDEDNKPICVKSAQIDGIELKEDTYYILQDKNFKECVVIDGIISVVVNRHKNVLKVKNLGDEDITFIVKDGEIYSHGATIKEARESLIYKISNRDTSHYDNYTLDTKLTKKQAIEMYRVITGACEAGTRYFVEHNKIPRNLTVAKVIEITENQYGNNKLKEFFDV